ncbi:hypothetical protein CLU79DRAFT_473653 [Phycomyces nitens]|nr:hypothetical protein CLU79DRAFT_473653 [Phycomyces nitens]
MRFSFVFIALTILSPIALGVPIPINDPEFFGREIGPLEVSEQVIVQTNPIQEIANFLKKIVAMENFLSGQKLTESKDDQETQLYYSHIYRQRIERRDMADKIRHYSGAYFGQDDGSYSQSPPDSNESEEEA